MASLHEQSVPVSQRAEKSIGYIRKNPLLARFSETISLCVLCELCGERFSPLSGHGIPVLFFHKEEFILFGVHLVVELRLQEGVQDLPVQRAGLETHVL